jgi:hypothetical protein
MKILMLYRAQMSQLEAVFEKWVLYVKNKLLNSQNGSVNTVINPKTLKIH